MVFLCIPLAAAGQNGAEFALNGIQGRQYSSELDGIAAKEGVGLAKVSYGLSVSPPTVKIHPNPSSRDLYVTLAGNGTSGKVIVYDILGNVIVEGDRFEILQGTATWSHNVSDWHAGTYVVRILHDDDVVKSLRFIKN
jgi:hypothetical protein